MNLEHTRIGRLCAGLAMALLLLTALTPPAQAQPLSQQSDPTSEAASGDGFLFQSDFGAMPSGLELLDENNHPLTDAPDLRSAADNAFLEISTRARRTLVLADADDWRDYAVEARVRATNGNVTLSARVADDLCAGYNGVLDFTSLTTRLTRSSHSCSETTLQSLDDPTLQSGEWTTLKVEVVGSQVMLLINGHFTLIGFDPDLPKGAPALVLNPAPGKNGVFDIDSLTVTPLRAPPTRLTDYKAAPGDAVAELQQLGQVPADKGQPIFVEDHTFMSGTGSYTVALARTAPHTNIVMAGEMTFKAAAPTSSYEDCGLIARLVDKSGRNIKQLAVAFDNNGYLNVYEYADPTSDQPESFYTAQQGQFTPGKTYHLLFTLVGSQLAAYVNGRLTLVVNDLVDVRAGYYAIGEHGMNANTRCDGRSVWVYSLD